MTPIRPTRKDELLTARMNMPGTGKTAYSEVLDAGQTGGIDEMSIVIEHENLPSLAAGKKIKAELLTKRLQFDCHPELYAEVERVCALLSCSKRRFLEMAVLSALDKSEQIFMETFHDAHGQEFTTVYAPKGDE